jgi:hypothetical protein
MGGVERPGSVAVSGQMQSLILHKTGQAGFVQYATLPGLS